MFFPLLTAANADSPDFASLSRSKIWLNQLQYRQSLWGSWISEADGPDFFVSPVGSHSPEEELRANYEIFLKFPEKPWGFIKQPIICAFPTRRKFLEDALGIKFKSIPCDDREQWKEAFRGSQLYLIFSDAYPNNPASMFGHTFFLFSRHSPPDSAKGLMDYAINFSAETNSKDEKSFLHSFKGVFGGYEGHYRIYSFYQMVNQYVQWDSRDLWYLKLPFSADQIERMTDHIWEIFTTTYFDYYFANENCSYRLLAALDYADPTSDLIEKFYFPIRIHYVAPVSTYKAVRERYKEAEEYYSPSVQKNLKTRIDSLSIEKRARFDQIRNDMSLISGENDIEVVDALVGYFDYRKRLGASLYLPESVLVGLGQSLQRRAQLGQPSARGPVPQRPPSPLEAHSIRSGWMGVGRLEEGSFVEAGIMMAYHDLLSPTAGLQRWSHLNFMETILRKVEDRTFLKSLRVADLMSFFPVESYDIKYSWRAHGGFDDIYKNYLQGGIGISWQSQTEMHLLYTFLNPTLSSHEELTNRRGVFFELEIGWAAEFSSNLKTWLTYKDILRSSQWNMEENYERLQLHLSYPLGKTQELRLGGGQEFNGRFASVLWRQQF